MSHGTRSYVGRDETIVITLHYLSDTPTSYKKMRLIHIIIIIIIIISAKVKVFVFVFCFGATAPPPPGGHGLLVHEVSRSHTMTHQSVGLLCTSDQLVAETSDNIPHSQQTNIHAAGGIRTQILNR